MISIKDTVVPSSIYNALPHISDVERAPDEYAGDLQDLRALLRKHQVPDGVSVRLIHKHYDAEEGEVMVFKQISVPSQGNVISMGPQLAAQSSGLRGNHFFVDADGTFQAYEYTTVDTPDMSEHGVFLSQFSHIVASRGLQRIFGLKFAMEAEEKGWTEFEFPNKRSTIIIPNGMPVPEGVDYSFEVATEWGKTDDGFRKRGCRHCSHITTCKHCKHKSARCGQDLHADEYILGGQKIDEMSPVHPIINAVAAVW